MPIPSFSIDGVLPPFVGPDGPGGRVEDMTPFIASCSEVVASFGVTPLRRNILRGWLQHRADLRILGFGRGFQWLDGSFVEDKVPRDLDIVTFTHRPPATQTVPELSQLMRNNLGQFQRAAVKARYNLDALFVDLNGSPETIVNASRYYIGLFSHRREDGLWKGMLEVRMEDGQGDAAAVGMLDALDHAGVGVLAP